MPAPELLAPLGEEDHTAGDEKAKDPQWGYAGGDADSRDEFTQAPVHCPSTKKTHRYPSKAWLPTGSHGASDSGHAGNDKEDHKDEQNVFPFSTMPKHLSYRYEKEDIADYRHNEPDPAGDPTGVGRNGVGTDQVHGKSNTGQRPPDDPSSGVPIRGVIECGRP